MGDVHPVDIFKALEYLFICTDIVDTMTNIMVACDVFVTFYTWNTSKRPVLLTSKSMNLLLWDFNKKRKDTKILINMINLNDL